MRRESAYQRSSVNQVRSAASQLWRFANEVRRGDMVVLPRKNPKVVAVGRVASDYVFDPDLPAAGPHIRRIEWRVSDVPRANFDQDLLYSMGGLLTVFLIKREDAVVRIEQTVNAHLKGDSISESEDVIYVPDDEMPDSSLDEQIEDRIVRRIRQKFPGVRLEYLVASVLRASGYNAMQTRPGPDGGIDVVAGRGDMGFGEPRLCGAGQVWRHSCKTARLQSVAGEHRRVRGTTRTAGQPGGFHGYSPKRE